MKTLKQNLMNSIYLTVIFLIIISITSCSNSNEKDDIKTRKGWELVWEDNFDDGLNESNWEKISKGNTATNRYMSSNDELFLKKVDNLVLRGIVNTEEDDKTPFLTSGIFRECFKKGETSRVEIRARGTLTSGSLPYISLLPSVEKSDISVNIMNQYDLDKFIYQTITSDYTIKEKMVDNPPSMLLVQIDPSEFHIYGVEKYPDSIVFFVDGVRTRKYPRIKTAIKGQFPFNELDFNLHLGLSIGKEVIPEELPVDLYIDWVRYYQPAIENFE